MLLARLGEGERMGGSRMAPSLPLARLRLDRRSAAPLLIGLLRVTSLAAHTPGNSAYPRTGSVGPNVCMLRSLQRTTAPLLCLHTAALTVWTVRKRTSSAVHCIQRTQTKSPRPRPPAHRTKPVPFTLPESAGGWGNGKGQLGRPQAHQDQTCAFYTAGEHRGGRGNGKGQLGRPQARQEDLPRGARRQDLPGRNFFNCS